MDAETVDAVVIGMGPGGEDVAGRLAEAGLSVVGIEAELVGGECPYWGCIPSKMMIRAAHLLAEARRIPGMAGTSTVTPDWAPVAERIRAEATDTWDDTVAVDRFVGKGGRFVRGRGRLVAPDRVEVGDQAFVARRAVVLATGTAPAIPPIEGLADTPYWTNRGAVAATEVPGRLVVLGGGAIGAELAQVFARFGSAVTVVEAADRLLPLDEPEAGAIVAGAFAADGIDVITGVGAERVAHADGAFTVTLADGRTVEADELLVATGRRADSAGLGAGAVGVPDDARWVPVDDHLRVADGVWAVGDLTGKGAFTHVAMYQAGIAAADILGDDHEPADYAALPRVTFTDPEVGAVGRTEADAREAGIDVAVGVAQVPSSARGWIHKAGNEGFIKLVADRERGVLVGATSAGPVGGEVLGHLALAVHARVPLATLRTMIYAYPTFHRGIEDALRDLDA
ncbi:NAD(P)/FAD-dependent oxidoreductase [Iamia sp. SCSIO 61187]|uniref:dihydrolipoyl dehydrogenase family protein n=1 Tax=Iamia sp. SCSIO 61187 TaxID=2722752 RepID=UPI001C629A73|nr:NAD(P)/FAD-dependent oxidoreductase [Iamia sp. SCSIO 61187]QYG95141.1 NAD(P)/FAD-dependent oxidoreductase [Iamia sp. SCSIO 61187]